MDQVKKIAYFIGTLKKRDDGVARVLLKLIDEGRAKGIESVIVTGWAEDKNNVPVPVYEVPSVVFPLYREYRFPLPGVKRFYPKLDAFRPDIIHVHSPDTIAWTGLRYARSRHIPIIATHHTDFARYLKYYHLSAFSQFLWFLLRRLYNKLDFVTTPSSVTTHDLLSHGVERVETIPWGTELERFDPSFRSDKWRKAVLKKNQNYVVLFVGRLTWEKDLKTLAETYALLREKRDDFAMVIAGRGPDEEDLKKLMPDAVFLGYKEGREFSECYASSDVFLFPSSTETFGNVTIEAMASGLVPVVANEGGSQSLVKEGTTGFLCTPRDPQNFFEKTNRLLDDEKLREKMRARCLSFAQDFSWSAVFQKMYEIYKTLITKNRQ